jgi:hypothetical protein
LFNPILSNGKGITIILLREGAETLFATPAPTVPRTSPATSAW